MSLAPEREGGGRPWEEPSALGPLLESYRPRLRRMVSLRLDPRVRRRVDSSDILQEAFVEVTRRLDEYEGDAGLSFFVWVRLVTGQKLVDLHRQHLGAEKRDVRREILPAAPMPASSISLARAIIDHSPTPSQRLMREEQQERLRAALDGMKESDREILMLRHFERLSNEECAEVLGLTPSGAKLRHMRAATRLREVLREYPDLGDGLGAP